MATLGRLMSSELPQLIEPLRLARAEEKITGQFLVSSMQRLVELLHDDTGSVSFNLDFIRNEAEKVYSINGQIETVLQAQCQRCLKKMALPLRSRVSLGIVTSQSEAEELPGNYEPLYLDEDETVVLVSLIEDELLLAMPISPMHEKNACDAAPILEALQEQAKNRPFRELKKLTQKLRQ